jgi:predicted TIM-barrel fold metal-dependent hydrolase
MLPLGQPSSADAPHRIDVHHHYYSPEWFAYLTNHHKNTYAFPGLTILRKWSAAADIEAMDEGGVQTAMLSTTTPGVWFGDAADARRMARNMNDYGAELVRAYPGRFGLFGTLPLPDVQGSLEEVAYVMDTLGADGIGVLSSYGAKWLGDPHFEPLWAELDRRGAVVFSHATAPDCCRNLMPGILEWVIEFNTDTARTIIQLIESGAAERYPNIRFVFSHAGGTIAALAGRYLDEQVAPQVLRSEVASHTKLGQLRRFFYDTAGAANIVNMQALKSIVPASQIVLGTDFPWYTPAAIVAGLAESGLIPAELRCIERDNALRLLPQYRTVTT